MENTHRQIVMRHDLDVKSIRIATNKPGLHRLNFIPDGTYVKLRKCGYLTRIIERNVSVDMFYDNISGCMGCLYRYYEPLYIYHPQMFSWKYVQFDRSMSFIYSVLAFKSVPPVKITIFPKLNTSKPKNFLNKCYLLRWCNKKSKSVYIVKQSVMGFSYFWPKKFLQKCNK